MMEIRPAKPYEVDEIVSLYQKSQTATGLPDPEKFPPASLEKTLYSRSAIERYVAVEAGRIAGHGLIEQPNPLHIDAWKAVLETDDKRPLIEMGAAFVDPGLSRRGIWTALLLRRLEIIRDMQAVPVCASWSQNRHIVKNLAARGGLPAGAQETPAGSVELFVFEQIQIPALAVGYCIEIIIKL